MWRREGNLRACVERCRDWKKGGGSRQNVVEWVLEEGGRGEVFEGIREEKTEGENERERESVRK